MLSNVEQTLITIVNTIVQAEIKENNPDGLIDDKSNLIIDVNIHKSFEEIVFESKNNELKDVISLPEIKPMQETSIKLDSEKVTNQNSNNIVLIDQVPLDNAKLDKKSKKSKNFIKSLFSRIQKPKKIDSSVKVVETSEFVPTVNHVTNNNIIKKEETSVLEQHEILDNEQKLRVKQMRNKASDVILDKLKLENFFVDGKNETTIKNLVLRSIDLIRYNKIQSFKQLGDSLKKEFFMINDEKTIDKLVSSLEDFLITKRVLKDLDLQPEKYEVIMFPCDFEPKTFQAKIDTKQVAEVSTSLNDVKENPAPVETNFKSQTNSSKFSWAIGLDSSPGSNKVYEKENPNSSQAVYANSITSNPSIVNEKKMEIDKGIFLIFQNLKI